MIFYYPVLGKTALLIFVDRQLSLDPNESLLFIKCFNVEPPYRRFYQLALAGISRTSEMVYGESITELDQSRAVSLIEALRDGKRIRLERPAAAVGVSHTTQ